MEQKSKTVPLDLVASLREALKTCSNARPLPPLSNKEIKQLELLVDKFPKEFVKLLKVTRGIEFKNSHSIRFDTPMSGNENLFSRSLLLGTDDYGDFATLEFGTTNDSIGPVMYFCHDPSRLIISSKTLAEFLIEVIPVALRSEDRPYLSKKVESKLFAKSTGDMKPASSNRELLSGSRQFESWKSKLPASAVIFDLSKADTGGGFDWAAFGSDTSLLRFKNELAFAAFPAQKNSQRTLKLDTQENLLAISSVNDIKFPCMWFAGPHPHDRVKFSYTVIRAKRWFRFTPFWPIYSNYFPGGILDAAGNLYEFKELKGWRLKPEFLPNYLEGIFFSLRRIYVKFDILMLQPIQLDQEMFKNKIIEMTLGKNQHNASQSNNSIVAIQKLEAAKEYSELIEWVNWYQKTDGGSVL